MSGNASRRGTAARTAKRRLGLLRRLVLRPADTWLVIRMVGWRLSLPLLKRRMSLPRLIGFMWEGDQPTDSTPEGHQRIAELTTVVFRSDHRDRPGNCLDRSLVAYRYLSAAGAEPQLLVGLRRGDGLLKGHAWVTVGGEPVEESPEPLEEFAQVVAFHGAGIPSRSEAVGA